MKLISMTDFVSWQEQEMKGDFALTSMYKNFLKQPLELWMFVPCDEEGKPLDLSDLPCTQNKSCYCGEEQVLDCTEYKREYRKAKERVLLEGYGFGNETSDVNQIYHDLVQVKLDRLIFTKKSGKCLDAETVEDLINCELTFTPTALKQIGL